MSHILRDVVAFANTDGGTRLRRRQPGRQAADRRRRRRGGGDGGADGRAGQAGAAAAVRDDRDVVEVDRKQVLAIRVARGPDRPYALAPGAIFVRRDAESRRRQSRRDRGDGPRWRGMHAPPPPPPVANGERSWPGAASRAGRAAPPAPTTVPSDAAAPGRRRGRRGDHRVRPSDPRSAAAAVAPIAPGRDAPGRVRGGGAARSDRAADRGRGPPLLRAGRHHLLHAARPPLRQAGPQRDARPRSGGCGARRSPSTRSNRSPRRKPTGTAITASGARTGRAAGNGATTCSTAATATCASSTASATRGWTPAGARVLPAAGQG